jgi:hypothetical protein
MRNYKPVWMIFLFLHIGLEHVTNKPYLLLQGTIWKLHVFQISIEVKNVFIQ